MCPRRIGFLFPHPCDRVSPIGCPDCDNGQLADPYAQREDRGAYSDYDQYDSAQWGDFTEADGENLVTPEEDEFEVDAGAS